LKKKKGVKEMSRKNNAVRNGMQYLGVVRAIAASIGGFFLAITVILVLSFLINTLPRDIGLLFYTSLSLPSTISQNGIILIVIATILVFIGIIVGVARFKASAIPGFVAGVIFAMFFIAAFTTIIISAGA
jgi:hypothetical protein